MFSKSVKTVYIIGGDKSYSDMFLVKGWGITNDLKTASLLQFTGGSDITPSFYGEKNHPKTRSNLLRDKRERIIFYLGKKYKIPMVGICRGAQFLNVMNGGKLWQHVDNHFGVGVHKVVDMITGQSYSATSTHHQMMRPHKTAVILGLASEAFVKERIGLQGEVIGLNRNQVNLADSRDEEVIFYENSKSLCFQPHPEFPGHQNLTDWYFWYIKKSFNF